MINHTLAKEALHRAYFRLLESDDPQCLVDEYVDDEWYWQAYWDDGNFTFHLYNKNYEV